MSKLSFDYSRFDRIVDSDDEESHHPNLDAGLNRRVIRTTRGRQEEEVDKEIESLKRDKATEQEIERAEKKRPLHSANMCKIAEERTIITSSDGTQKDRLIRDSEQFVVDDYMEFKTQHQRLFDEFTNADWDKSHDLLAREGGILLDDYAKNYFLLATLEAQMANNMEEVQKLGKQGQIISQIHQLAVPMKRPPRDLVHRFFERFETQGGRDAFQEGVDHFLRQIKKRANQKRKEEAAAARAEAEAAATAEAARAQQLGEPVSLVEAMHEMTPEQRMGPGGLDPVEIFAGLPESMQECFRSGDVEKLKELSQTMPAAEFEKHFSNCIASGLWSAGGSSPSGEDAAAAPCDE